MALTVAQADEMVEATRQAGVIFKVYENFIFYPPVQRAKALIDDGEIGDLLTIRIKSNSGISPNEWDVPASALDWRYDPEECGGGPLVFDDGHHKFALGWHFMGMAEQVHAWIGSTVTLCRPRPRFAGDCILEILQQPFRFPGSRLLARAAIGNQSIRAG